jgi:RHS repeat-associated protein
LTHNLGGPAAISHDDNGNLSGDGTWAYGYDTDNRLASADKAGIAAALGYDALGRLHKIDINGTVTEQLYDGDDLVAEYGTDGTLLRRYVHGPGTDEPISRYEGDGTAGKLWLYADHQGSIVAAANTAGNMATTHSYGPFGEPDRVGGLKHRYTGQQWLAALNLYYYKARMYSPTLGKFLQPDPIGYGDGLNLYAYVGNNPVNFADPTGLIALADFLSKGIKVVNQFLESHPKTGIPFKNGFPDFSSVAIDEVKLANLSGTAKDFDLANKAAGYANTPSGFTWHHVEDGAGMQLVPTDIHSATGHTGGSAWLKAGGTAAGGMAAGNANASTGITWNDAKNFAKDTLTDPSTYYTPLMLLTPSSTGGCSNGVCSDMIHPTTSFSRK